MTSILNTIKSLLGIDLEETSFDLEIMTHINSVISVLSQIGVDTNNCIVSSSSTSWSELIGFNATDIELIKTYIFIKVKLLFDPPSSATVLDAFNKQASEYEWRIYSIYNVNEET